MTQGQQQQQGQTPQQNQAPVRRFAEETVTMILDKVSKFQTQGGLKLPSNYSAENSVRAAWLILQDVKGANDKPALEICTPDSVANALLNMVLQGLNPVKKQCYFIVYGNKLELQKSYIGNIAISKRVANVKEVKGVPIYEGDKFKYEINKQTGRKTIIEHEQDFMNIDPDKTIGAYAIIQENDGGVWVEVMNMKQITAAWQMGRAGGASKAHKGFKDEMACKTVINRALKVAVGSSDDADMFEDTELEDSPYAASVKHNIAENANNAAGGSAIGFEDEGEVQAPEVLPESTPAAPEAPRTAEVVPAVQPIEQPSSEQKKRPF